MASLQRNYHYIDNIHDVGCFCRAVSCNLLPFKQATRMLEFRLVNKKALIIKNVISIKELLYLHEMNYFFSPHANTLLLSYQLPSFWDYQDSFNLKRWTGTIKLIIGQRRSWKTMITSLSVRIGMNYSQLDFFRSQ